MDINIKEFIIENKDLIEQDKWVDLYSKAYIGYSLGFVGDLTSTLVDAGINPLDKSPVVPTAYYYQQPIREFVIPKNIRKINSYAFANCIELYKITIPKSVEHIYSKAFYNNTSLKDIYYQGTKDQWKNIAKEANYFYMIPESCIIHSLDGDIKVF